MIFSILFTFMLSFAPTDANPTTKDVPPSATSFEAFLRDARSPECTLSPEQINASLHECIRRRFEFDLKFGKPHTVPANTYKVWHEQFEGFPAKCFPRPYEFAMEAIGSNDLAEAHYEEFQQAVQDVENNTGIESFYRDAVLRNLTPAYAYIYWRRGEEELAAFKDDTLYPKASRATQALKGKVNNEWYKSFSLASV